MVAGLSAILRILSLMPNWKRTALPFGLIFIPAPGWSISFSFSKRIAG